MKVSVSMVTYNHERYIVQAIESVLMQRVNFDYELVIGEDCSTDHTRKIVVDYRNRYPDKIRLVLSDTNLGPGRNVEQTLAACQGQYIAVLEGDDYWTSSDKLQKQVDFLDSHPECAMCCTRVNTFYEDGSHEPGYWPPADQKPVSALEDLLVRNFVLPCSEMYRSGLVNELPEWAFNVRSPDWVFSVLMTQHGKIGYINEVMATYRIHKGGVWGGLSTVQKLEGDIEFYARINAYLNFRYEAQIQQQVSWRWEKLEALCVEQTASQSVTRAVISDLIAQLKQWSMRSGPPSGWKVDVPRRVWATLFFASYQIRDLSGVRYCWSRMVRSDPAWLRNRGVWSIGAEAFLGQRVARLLRSIV